MKKLGIGCLVVVGLLVIAISIGSYIVAGKVKQFVGGFAQLEQIPALNDQIRNRSDYRPPADGRLEPAQIERYVGVQRAMLQSLGPRVRQLDEKYKTLSSQLEAKGREPNLREILGAWNDVITLVVDAKKSQVAALNAAGLSLGEYHWVRTQSLLAMGHGAFGWNLEALASDPSNLTGAMTTADAPDAATLQHNRDLLRVHEDRMDEWLPLSFFGL